VVKLTKFCRPATAVAIINELKFNGYVGLSLAELLKLRAAEVNNDPENMLKGNCKS